MEVTPGQDTQFCTRGGQHTGLLSSGTFGSGRGEGRGLGPSHGQHLPGKEDSRPSTLEAVEVGRGPKHSRCWSWEQRSGSWGKAPTKAGPVGIYWASFPGLLQVCRSENPRGNRHGPSPPTYYGEGRGCEPASRLWRPAGTRAAVLSGWGSWAGVCWQRSRNDGPHRPLTWRVRRRVPPARGDPCPAVPKELPLLRPWRCRGPGPGKRARPSRSREASSGTAAGTLSRGAR